MMSMFELDASEVLVSQPTGGTAAGFTNAVTVWINKPHVVNRRLCGSRILHYEKLPKHRLTKIAVKNILGKLDFDVYNFISFEGESEPVSFKKNSCDKLSSYNEQDGICKEDEKLAQIGNDADCSCEDHGATPVASADLQTAEVNSGDKLQMNPVCELDGLANLDKDCVAIIVREMLPKQPERHRNMPELIIFDKSEDSFTFYPLVPPSHRSAGSDWIEVVYRLVYCLNSGPVKSHARIVLSTSCSDCERDSERKLSITWLQGQLVKKLVRWSEEAGLKTSLTSLLLVPLEDYSRLYSELKTKYGLHFAKVWPEKTDPQKFVFEDVAIATYLLLLWKQDREKKGFTSKQSFVDLGCGNGLLVHILSSEGHPGYGIDVRRRNIWSLYGPETVLKEMAITPSSESLYPDCDWLIGNHSDELTPWIPVMSARSSYSCCYFVLPCCHFDFNSKFNHDSAPVDGAIFRPPGCSPPEDRPPGGSPSEEGQYRSYLNFVKAVGERCGFNVEEDMLRIPSTKRVCFVGQSRWYDRQLEDDMDQSRQQFISARCQQNLSGKCQAPTSTHSVTQTSDQAINGAWADNFTPRERIEKTRNCATVSAEIKHHVITTVFDKVLHIDPDVVTLGHDGKSWRRGGSLPIGQVASLFDKSVLQELKSECGGLQTLLRNYSHVFQVSSGVVQLRDFTKDDPFEGRRGTRTDRDDFWKTKRCWFKDNHPDGCPRVSINCPYAHGDLELREKPTKNKPRI